MQAALKHELTESWRSLNSLLADQAAAAERVAIQPTDQGSPTYAEAREAASRAVLLEILDRWERLRPLKRAELAIEAYHRGVDDLCRRLPASVPATGAEVLATVSPTAGTGLGRWAAGLRKERRACPLQGIVATTLRFEEARSLRIEVRYLMSLALGVQELRRGWDRARERLDSAHASPEAARVAVEAAPATAAKLDTDVRSALSELDRSFAGMFERAADRLVSTMAWGRAQQAVVSGDRRTRHLEHWAAQLGWLENELRFERAQDGVERRLLAMGKRTADLLEAERRGLIEGIDQFVEWLDRRLGGAAAGMPSSMPTVVPALRRSSDLAAAVRQILDALPNELELVRRLEPVAGHRANRKAITPGRMATEAFERVGRARFDAVFENVQAGHVGLVQQIERARQVVEFASEEEGEADDASVVRESLQNARSLLEVDRGATSATLPAERAVIARTLADMFLENRVLLTRSRLGALAHLGRLGARRGALALAAAALPALLGALKVAGGTARRLWRRFLIAIQWIPATESKSEQVVRRPYLPREFTLDPREKDLPAIYRRLFRFEAVDDSRFLVGRDREMQALVEAREFWEEGRPVAALVVGERGSGKTSLINCAIEGPLAGLTVVRGEFNARLATAPAVRAFIANLCGTTPDLLETTLLSGRRVLVLEETERTFLRDMGGFDGISELQRLIASTCGTTLWVLVTNQHAFRFLDAAVKLGASFSHRLNAASAAPEAVRQAILVRHNLSGLRLRFVPPAPQGSLLARLRRRVQGEGDPEELFPARAARATTSIRRAGPCRPRSAGRPPRTPSNPRSEW